MIRKIFAAAALAVTAPPSPAISAAAQEPERPKLVIAIAIDQLGSNLFERYRPRSSGGLARMARERGGLCERFQAHRRAQMVGETGRAAATFVQSRLGRSQRSASSTVTPRRAA
ncbi:MAG: hypothetical protein ACFBQW_07780 [Sphingomonadaceae bacterium]